MGWLEHVIEERYQGGQGAPFPMAGTASVTSMTDDEWSGPLLAVLVAGIRRCRALGAEEFFSPGLGLAGF